MEHIWTILMLKIKQAHLLRAFVANLKIYAIYALYPESFCDKNLAVRKVFAFSDSGVPPPSRMNFKKTAFDLIPLIWKIMSLIFYDRYGCIYARRYDE